MVLGMSLQTFTLVHVVISLVAIVTGMVALIGMLQSKRLERLTRVFLTTTVLTSVTGFMFPFKGVTPAIVVGAISMVVLAVAMAVRYGLHMAGVWRGIYVVTANIALWFNCFVLVVQSFEKIPALHALAPTGKELPFAVAQLVMLGIIGVLTTLALKRFHPEAKAERAKAA